MSNLSKTVTMSKNRKKNTLLFILITIVFVLILITIFTTKLTTNGRNVIISEIQCIHDTQTETLPDISDEEPLKGKSIFFHETSCKSFQKGKIFIQARQACSVESAARHNPNRTVYLLYNSPGIIKFEGTKSDRILQTLLKYDNLKIRYCNFGRYFEGTPLEHLYTANLIDRSYYPIEHSSDAQRFLTLWKYGGIYLDLDVITLKTFDMPLNFAGLEDSKSVGSAVVSFGPDSVGNGFAKQILLDLRSNYKPTVWAMGPNALTRLAKILCLHSSQKEMKGMCFGFRLFPVKTFFPVEFEDNDVFFKSSKDFDLMGKITNETYTVHVWNAANGFKIERAQSVYMKLAQEFCPEVYKLILK